MNLKHFVRDAAYLCLGTAAVIVEKGGKVGSALIRKGAQTWHDNQDTVDEVKRRAKDLYAQAKEKMTPTSPDATQMTAEERAELRRQLDEADAVEADEITVTDEPAPEYEDESPAEDEAEDSPVEPTYTAAPEPPTTEEA